MPLTRPSDEQIALLKRIGDPNRDVSLAAQRMYCEALQTPLRQGILSGDILNGIFERLALPPGASAEYPLDLLSPGEEVDHVAYTLPHHGYVPQRAVEGDYLMISTFMIGSSIDYLLRYAREARWDIIARCAEILEMGFVKKINDDGWHTLLAAGADRGIMGYDVDAAAGQFTKRLITILKSLMRRNGGGNSTSISRIRLTDMYLSPEGVEDVRHWTVDQLDDTSRRSVFVAPDGASVLSNIFGINLHDLDELGEGQEYQLYYSTALGGTLGPNSDVELVVGLDRSKSNSFVMPVKQEVTVFDDPNLHREQRGGFYGWAELGFGVLDTRNIILGSF